MPPRRTVADVDPDQPVTQPGLHNGDYYCGCATLCHGVFKALKRSTYNYHKKYRTAEREAAVEQTYQYIVGGGSTGGRRQSQGALQSAGGTGGTPAGEEEDAMDWQQAYLDDDGDDEPDNAHQSCVDAADGREHDWHDDPDQETLERDRQELAGQYHPYWQGLSGEVEPDSDDEADSDDEDDGGAPPLTSEREEKAGERKDRKLIMIGGDAYVKTRIFSGR